MSISERDTKKVLSAMRDAITELSDIAQMLIDSNDARCVAIIESLETIDWILGDEPASREGCEDQ